MGSETPPSILKNDVLMSLNNDRKIVSVYFVTKKSGYRDPDFYILNTTCVCMYQL